MKYISVSDYIGNRCKENIGKWSYAEYAMFIFLGTEEQDQRVHFYLMYLMDGVERKVEDDRNRLY